jgi:hypothetical protein
MLTVDTIAKIRRAFFVEKKPIKAICRELTRSRTAVRRAIRSEATEFRYERSIQPMPKLGAWREELDKLLAANEAKSPRERLTLVRIFETLRDRGFNGGYDAVRRYAKSWRKARGAATAQAYILAASQCAAAEAGDHVIAVGREKIAVAGPRDARTCGKAPAA